MRGFFDVEVRRLRFESVGVIIGRCFVGSSEVLAERAGSGASSFTSVLGLA